MQEVTDNLANSKFMSVLTIIPTILSWQTVQFFPIPSFPPLSCLINLISNLSITQDSITTMNLGLFLALIGTKQCFLLPRVEKCNWYMLRFNSKHGNDEDRKKTADIFYTLAKRKLKRTFLSLTTISACFDSYLLTTEVTIATDNTIS